MTNNAGDKEWDLNAFFDTKPFWVIWQIGLAPGGAKRIRRITQSYGSEALARADAERYGKSGVITWVEKASPLAPLDVPVAAIEALGGPAGAPTSVGAIALAAA